MITERFWHKANPDGTGSGKIVCPEMSEEMFHSPFVVTFQNHWSEYIDSLPETNIYCNPTNKVEWIEGEKQYQFSNTENGVDSWVNIPFENFQSLPSDMTRIWIEPKYISSDPTESNMLN